MGIADQIREMLQRANSLHEVANSYQHSYKELLDSGVVQKQEYDLPMVNVLGSSQIPVIIR